MRFFSVPTAKGLCGARRVAMMLLMTMLTSVGAWADAVNLSIDTNYSEGEVGYYYVNMPAKGTATTIGNAAQLDLSSSNVTSFKLYDDGGKGGDYMNTSAHNYSNSYTGYLVITAPTGCVINISGSIMTEKDCDKLTVWDGTDTTNDSKKLLDGVSSSANNQWTAITTVASTGNVITVYFNSDSSQNKAGLDLTVKIENPYDLENATISGVESWYSYTGSAISITPTVKDASGTTLTLGTHYTVTIKNSSNETVTDVIAEGDYTLTVTAKDGSGYTGSQSVRIAVVDCPEGFSIDTDYSKGEVGYYYVNMLKDGGYPYTAGYKTLTLPDGFTSAFKVYDDGGKGGNYSDKCRSYLTITAPIGYVLQLTGSILTSAYDYLTVWDGDDTNDNDKKLLNEIQKEVNDINITSTGRNMTLYFYSDEGGNKAGLDLTVTLIPIDIHDLQNATVSDVNSLYHYSGSPISITPTVQDASGTTLTLGTHYTATLNDNSVTTFPLSLAPGDYTLTVSGTGDYSGSKSVSFTVIPDGLSIDNDYNKGEVGYYYVNMPLNGGTSTTEEYKTVTLTNDFISAFKVYDNGGKSNNYSNGCNGYLIINAPSGYRIQVSGTIKTESSTTDYLIVYDGDYNIGHPGNLGDYKYGGFDGSNPVSIGTLTTTGNAMTLFFKSYKEGDTDAGLNLTVTLVPPTQYDITIDKTGLPDGCDVVSNKLTAAPYTDVTLTATAATGYVMTSLEVTDADGNTVEVDWDIFTTNDATFEMPASAVTVKPTFSNAKTADDGLAINMPKAGTKTAIIPDGVTSFIIYDDGGPGGSDDTSDADGNYSNNCNGTLVLTAPTGYKIKLLGSVTIVGSDYLRIENGSEIKNPSASVDLISTGTSLTLIFHSDESENRSGFLIRATLLDENTEYAVTVNNPAKGGTVSASINDENVTSAKLHQTVTLTVSTADGYQFDGISAVYTDNDFLSVTLTKVDDTHYTLTMPDAAVTVTPTFSGNAYTVAFDKNATDATGTMDPQAFTYGTAQALTANAFTRPDYAFIGWNTQADGNGTTYTNHQEVNNLTTEAGATVTLYAQWTFDSWTGGGDTADDPYIINSRNLLDQLAQRVNNGTSTYSGKFFKVTANIDYTNAPMSYDSGNSNFVAIGNSTNAFCGTFDGNGYTISGIVIENSNDYQGLFGYNSGNVKNVNLSNSSITGKNNVGAIAGANYSKTITNCSVDATVTVSGTDCIGGIVGSARGVSYCVSAATVRGTEYVGGIVGNDATTEHFTNGVDHCYYLGTSVTGTGYRGAIVGGNDNGNYKGVRYNYYRRGANVPKGYTSSDVTDNDGAIEGLNVNAGVGVTVSEPVLSLNVYGPGMTIAKTYHIFKQGQTVNLGHTDRDGLVVEDYTGKYNTDYNLNIQHSGDNYYFIMPNYNVDIVNASWLLSLANAGDNTANIDTYNGETLNVKLTGRTLYTDGDWNTLCLPFDVTDGDNTDDKTFSGTPLEGAIVKELNSLTSNLDVNGVLTLNFTNATKIEAGKPYIVKWESGSDIDEPEFTGVVIRKDAPTAVNFTGGSFVGNYAPLEVTDANRDNVLLLAAGNKLGYAKTDRTIANGKALGAFHAYFNIPGSAAAREFVLNFGDDESEASGIIDMEHGTLNIEHSGDNGWYDLNGQKLDGKPTKKGLYIVNGRKVVVK